MADVSAGEKLKVFISYSRRDCAAFADELVAGLELVGFAPLLDRHDIAAGEDWEARLGGLIAQSDTVVFVVSPEAVKSERCTWEVDRTLELSKRLLPVIFKSVPDHDIPEKLRRLQFVRFDTGRGVTRPLAELADALRQDLDWIREHTRLGEIATRWDRRGRPEALLLRGDEIDAAKTWMAARNAAAPEITDMQRAFVRASEEAESTRLHKEREQLEKMAAAQAERAKALAEREEALKREAEQARRVVVERDRARNALARVLAERSWTSLSNGNRDLAIRYALLGYRIAPSNAAHYRAPLAEALAPKVVPKARQLHRGRIVTIASSPDGRYAISGGQDGLAVLLDMASLHPIQTFPHEQPLSDAAIGPSGTSVLTISDDAVLHIWNIETGAEVRFLGHESRIVTACFSPDASRLLSASSDHTARLWDPSAGAALAMLCEHTDIVDAVAFSPDGRLLVTGSWDQTACIWDAEDGSMLGRLVKHTEPVTAVAFSPDGTLLLTGSSDRTVLVWDISTHESEPKKLMGHEGGIRAVSTSSDGLKAYVIDFDGNAYIWDIQTSAIIVASPSTTDGHGLTSFTLDGAYAAISSKAGGLRVWDAEAARTLIELKGSNSAAVSEILWSKNNLLVGDESGTLSVYDLTEVTQSIDELVARACAKERALSQRFTWMESAADPLIREVWDPEGIARPVCK